MAISLVTILLLIAYKRRQFKKNKLHPFYAVTNEGFLISANGQIADSRRMSWADVRNRFKSEDRTWRFGDQITNEFGILLNYKDRIELIAELERRVHEFEEKG